MFGNLKDYKQNVEFYSENPLVKFSPEFETGEYVIYGYFVTHVKPEQHSSGEVFHYHDYIEKLNDEETFNWYINEVQKRNQIVSPVDVQYGDKLLCLSTCSNEFSDSRFVVFARRLREDEKIEDFDFSETYLNYNAEGVDWEAIMSNDTTELSSEEETSEVSETESETESEIISETEVPKEAEKTKKEETEKSDTRRSYQEALRENRTKTTATTTEPLTETETEISDDSSTETSVPEGEEAETETATPSDSDRASEETTAPEETAKMEETTVPESAE